MRIDALRKVLQVVSRRGHTAPAMFSETQQASMTPIYDPALSYEENYHQGPFGRFAEAPEACGRTLAASRQTLLGQPVDLPFGIAAGPLPPL